MVKILTWTETRRVERERAKRKYAPVRYTAPALPEWLRWTPDNRSMNMVDLSELERRAKEAQRRYRLVMAALSQKSWESDPRRDILARQARQRYDVTVAKLREQAMAIIDKARQDLDERRAEAVQLRTRRLERAFAKVPAMAAEQFRQIMAAASDRTVLEAYRGAEPGSWQRLVIESLGRTDPQPDADGMPRTSNEAAELRRLIAADSAALAYKHADGSYGLEAIPTDEELDAEARMLDVAQNRTRELDPEAYRAEITQRFQLAGVGAWPEGFTPEELDQATLELGAVGARE